MSTGAQMNLRSIGPISVHGADYEVCAHESANGTVQLAWIVKAGIVVARINGLGRGEPWVGDKETALAWPDESDEEAAASAGRVWMAAGMPQSRATNVSGDVRQKIDVFDLDGSEITMFQREGDPFDTVRLAYTGALDSELGRVVDLDGARPRLATALAVWTTDTRIAVTEIVKALWRFYELEVIA
jgi:hypothetical protein